MCARVVHSGASGGYVVFRATSVGPLPIGRVSRDAQATYAAGDVIRGPGVAFRVRRVLGVGGMGEVYEVDDLELGVHVALRTGARKEPK